MPVLTNCPGCSKAIQVPDEYLGKQVRCPACATQFMTDGVSTSAEVNTERLPARPVHRESGSWEDDELQTRRSQGEDKADEAERFEEPREEYYEPPRRRRTRRDALAPAMAPAICLIITGILGVLVNGFQIVYASVAKPAPQKVAAADKPEDPLQRFQKEFEESATGPPAIIGGALFLIASVIVIMAGVTMLTGKAYGFGIAGSVIAIINIGNCCCFLGIPFGIWSLIVLSKPDVKAAFD